MSWRNAQASMQLIAEINARWPRRDRASDGTIGDAAHATRTSDHNPWVKKGGLGVVRARDIDKDGIDAAWLAEYLRQLGARRDPRLWPAGYIIFNRRITAPDFSRWNTYRGSNPHTAHVHVSFSTDMSTRGFDSTAGWGIHGAPAPGPAVTQPAAPTVKKVKPVIQNFPVVGNGALELNTPIKGASALYHTAYVSVRSTAGGGKVDVWWGMTGKGGRGEAHWTLNANERRWTELTTPDFADQTTIHYAFGAGVHGAITVEFAPK